MAWTGVRRGLVGAVAVTVVLFGLAMGAAARTGAGADVGPTTSTRTGPAPGGVFDRIWKGSADVAAAALGITADQLRTETELGDRSVAEVAVAHGRAPEVVQAAVTTAALRRLDDAVGSGALTEADAAGFRARVPGLADRYVHAPQAAGHGTTTTSTTASSAPSNTSTSTSSTSTS
ncbi:MAG: hypothetical protein R2726_15440 [Acidimicrobiales bacterium]